MVKGKTRSRRKRAKRSSMIFMERGWFAVFTAENTVGHPIMIVSMVEDV